MNRSYLTVLIAGPLLVLVAGVVAAWSPGADGEARPACALVYADAPPLAHTGGFGEPTCHACHFGYEVNGAAGSLTVEGLPEAYRPGARYRLTVRVVHAEMPRSGFMLSTRFASGAQAGTLRPADSMRVAVSVADASGVQYAHHTLAGTAVPEPDTATWRLVWIAPSDTTSADTVLVHAAANAANDDASEFGDAVYATEQRLGAE